MRGFTYTYYGILFPNGILKFKTKTSKDAFARASAKTSIYLFRIEDCIKQVGFLAIALALVMTPVIIFIIISGIK